MRPCACDTAARLCVRTVLCSSAFLSVPPLPSIGSAAACAALFANFFGTIGESDCSLPRVACALCPRFSPVGPLRTASQGGDGALPVPVQEASMHARVPDDAG